MRTQSKGSFRLSLGSPCAYFLFSLSGECSELKIVARIFALLVGAVLLLALWNAPVAFPVIEALAEEDQVSAIAYRRWFISPTEIVFDLRGVGPEGSMALVDRSLFLAAHALKKNRFESVALAWRGDTKFLLAGYRFQTIGREWPYQNSIYVIRTMQEDISTPDGLPAFGIWTGGLLGVLAKQLEDHNQLHRKWWVNEKLGTWP